MSRVSLSAGGITCELSQDYSTQNRGQGRIHEPTMAREACDKHDETSCHCPRKTHYEVHNRPVSASLQEFVAVCSGVTGFPPRLFILRNSRSATRSKSRSPQQVNITDSLVVAKIRNFVSLARRALSRSGNPSTRSIGFVNMEIS
jgi:hypothetical protein